MGHDFLELASTRGTPEGLGFRQPWMRATPLARSRRKDAGPTRVDGQVAPAGLSHARGSEWPEGRRCRLSSTPVGGRGHIG
jgi:hypothetical protein